MIGTDYLPSQGGSENPDDKDLQQQIQDFCSEMTTRWKSLVGGNSEIEVKYSEQFHNLLNAAEKAQSSSDLEALRNDFDNLFREIEQQLPEQATEQAKQQALEYMQQRWNTIIWDSAAEGAPTDFQSRYGEICSIIENANDVAQIQKAVANFDSLMEQVKQYYQTTDGSTENPDTGNEKLQQEKEQLLSEIAQQLEMFAKENISYDSYIDKIKELQNRVHNASTLEEIDQYRIEFSKLCEEIRNNAGSGTAETEKE